jgi:broad specificity phosphatase PhoE
LIFVKHAAPQVVAGVPPALWHLGADGKHACRALAARLAPHQPAVLFCSHELKAIETAALTAQHLGARVQLVANLHEHDRANAPYYATKEEFEDAVRRFFHLPDQLVFGAETASQARARFAKAVDGIRAAHGDHAVIVAHGTVITLYAAPVLGVDEFELWRGLQLPDVLNVKM